MENKKTMWIMGLIIGAVIVLFFIPVTYQADGYAFNPINTTIYVGYETVHTNVYGYVYDVLMNPVVPKFQILDFKF